MKIRIVATALACLTLLAGVADAAPKAGVRDDSLLTIDLSPVEGGIYFLMCETMERAPASSAVECRGLSVWQDSNIVPHLQSGKYTIGGKTHEADTVILA